MGKKLIFIIVGVVLVIVIGIVAVVLLMGGKEDTVKEPVYAEYKFDEAYSNLADEDKSRIVKYRVTVKYDSNDAEILDKITNNQEKLQNNFDIIVRETKSEDLTKPNGKARLIYKFKEMVIETLESDEEIIYEIYITPFVIQG